MLPLLHHFPLIAICYENASFKAQSFLVHHFLVFLRLAPTSFLRPPDLVFLRLAPTSSLSDMYLSDVHLADVPLEHAPLTKMDLSDLTLHLPSSMLQILLEPTHFRCHRRRSSCAFSGAVQRRRCTYFRLALTVPCVSSSLPF